MLLASSAGGPRRVTGRTRLGRAGSSGRVGVRGAEDGVLWLGERLCAKVSMLGKLRRLVWWAWFRLAPPRLNRETFDPTLDLFVHAHANFLEGVGG